MVRRSLGVLVSLLSISTAGLVAHAQLGGGQGVPLQKGDLLSAAPGTSPSHSSRSSNSSTFKPDPSKAKVLISIEVSPDFIEVGQKLRIRAYLSNQSVDNAKGAFTVFTPRGLRFRNAILFYNGGRDVRFVVCDRSNETQVTCPVAFGNELINRNEKIQYDLSYDVGKDIKCDTKVVVAANVFGPTIMKAASNSVTNTVHCVLKPPSSSSSSYRN